MTESEFRKIKCYFCGSPITENPFVLRDFLEGMQLPDVPAECIMYGCGFCKESELAVKRVETANLN